MAENVVSLRDGAIAEKRVNTVSGHEPDIDPDYYSCGRRLRHHRLEINGDAVSIAKEMRLPVAYLDAIEAGRWDKLPGRAFAICYVRDYARILGMDADELASCAKAEIAPVNTNRLFRFPTPMYGSSSSGGGLAVFVSVVVIAAVIAAVAYL